MKYVSTELRENEVFIANTSNIENFPRPELRGLKTIRMGDQALDINGNKLATDYCKPIFIHKAELDLYDKIMTKLHSAL